MLTVDMLAELDHTVHEAPSGEEALAILENNSIDVLVTDLGLPGMTGADLAGLVRDQWLTVRIVFASGDDSALSASGIPDALQLSKPFTADGLVEIISRARHRT